MVWGENVVGRRLGIRLLVLEEIFGFVGNPFGGLYDAMLPLPVPDVRRKLGDHATAHSKFLY